MTLDPRNVGKHNERLTHGLSFYVLLVFALLVFVTTSFADDGFVVRASSGKNISDIASRHGLKVVRSLDSSNQVYLLQKPSDGSRDQVEADLTADTGVATSDEDSQLTVAEQASVSQSTAAILDSTPSFPVQFFGDTVPSRYAFQNATSLLHLRGVQNYLKITGTGIVAIIDTGVDPNHIVLKDSLVPGYDFVHEIDGVASEFTDVSPDTAAVLTQSTAAILDQSTAAILDFSSVVILNQSTAAILDQSTAAILDTTQIPAAFGHGTMIAGIIHLTAPTAQIMPLKAFSGDGSATLSNIIRAIYYAVDHGATVINMSFSVPNPTAELAAALNYATSNGVVLVAAAGNTGKLDTSYPAAYNNVIGVGSTSDLDVRSTFSSFGPMVFVGAPGEGIISTYPGNHYAAAWGTSFSAPFVAGGASLLMQAERGMSPAQTADELGHAKMVPYMGKGRVDLYQAVKHTF